MTGARRFGRGGPKTESQAGEEHTMPYMKTDSQSMPNHPALPDVSRIGEVLFQLGVVANTVIMLGYQNLNLYNTIPWMPNAQHDIYIDVTKIDYDLIVLLVLFLSHRLLVVTCNMLYSQWTASLASVIKYSIMAVYYLTCVGTLYKLSTTYSYQNIALLLLPVLVHFLLFGPSLLSKFQLFQYLPSWLKRSPRNPYESLIPPPTENTSRSIHHACHPQPQNVRLEVLFLRSDFNYRLKLIYFETFKTVYYAVLVPLIFCKTLDERGPNWSTYHLDKTWLVLFVVETVFCEALVCFTYRITCNYLDTMHRCAMHLGYWIKLESRHPNIPSHPWSEISVWHKGVNVKHVKGLFKAEGQFNTAEPGDPYHVKFYTFFKRPDYLFLVTAVTTFVFVVFQFCLLVFYKHWYQLFSTGSFMFASYYCLHLALKDYLITARVYQEEKKKSD